jgi:DNA-binding NtrC family response regulator
MLRDLGFDVTVADNGSAAVTVLRDRKFDVLLSDLDLGGEIDGLGVLQTARAQDPLIKVVIMSGKSSAKYAVQPHAPFLQKPITQDTLSAEFDLCEPAD